MTTLLEAMNTTRDATMELLQQVTRLWETSGVPGSPIGVGDYLEKLQEGRYRVLVAGEAKRGKSSFVNAVIGKDLLPTDLKIATCQVFRVRNTDQEAYRLLYEDGSMEVIAEKDLAKYGSQVYADQEGTPSLDEIIRWIEIDRPIRFLPPEIELLDTPGLGSLYAVHAEIIYRFVPTADGVIFMLSSNHPVTDVEVEFLEELTQVTQNIFFIQTKIDEHRGAHWKEIMQRNKEVLEKRFEKTLGAIEVWPISSISLQKAVESGDDDYIKVSRFPELREALERFLMRVAGWKAMAEASLCLGDTIDQATRKFETQLGDLQEGSTLKRQQYRDKIADLRSTFNAEWGLRGSEKEALLADIKRDVDLGEAELRQSLHQTAGPIAKQFRKKIEELTSLEEAKEFKETLNQEVLSVAFLGWMNITKTIQSKATAKIATLVSDFRSADEMAREKWSGGTSGMPRLREVEDSLLKRFKVGFFEARFGAMAVGLPLVLISTFLLPLSPVIYLGAPLLAAMGFLLTGMDSEKSKQLRQTQDKFIAHLSQLLQNIQQEFFKVDLENEANSLVKEFLNSHMNSVIEALGAVCQTRQEELQDELANLDKQIEMSNKNREEEGRRLQDLVLKWKQQGANLESISQQLIKIDEHLLAGEVI